MTVPALALSTDPATRSEADVLVVAMIKTDEGPRLATDADELLKVEEWLAALGATGAADELIRVASPADGMPPLALVGLGGPVATPEAIRAAAGSAARQLAGLATVAIAVPDPADPEQTAAALEGAAVGAYAFTAYRTLDRPGPPSAVVVHGSAEEGALRHAEALALAVHTVRDLVNAPALDLYPETFAQRVRELADGLPVEVEVLDDEQLRTGGYGGIVGVGQGSVRGPRLVTVRYQPEGAERHVSLVGKGITFDSGGLSLKPAPAMVGMKYDMTGAATVLAVVLAAARLALPTRVTARLCLAENLPSGSAIRPNDVLRMRSGATVEVLNTDAEGRLVLADGLADASAEHPDALIDVATLTGAARLAMGERIAPVMGDAELAQRIAAAGARAGELFWPMPLAAELRAVIESDIADIANAKPGHTAGGMMVAGLFLQHFVGTVGEGAERRRIPWAHLDIAGVANNGGRGWGLTPKGATGATVRSLIGFVEAFGDDAKG
ncbi:MAG: leucyl aminopeptidase [Micrococcales bacterium]|nr:leucyl aminopeptidase [Micrococcales bacterium]